MSIFEDVSAQMKAAMKAKDADRLRALRGIRAAFIEGMKLDGSDTLDDAQCLALLKRVAKQRRDSVTAYTSGGRKDLADVEAAELAVVEEFLPAGPDEATVREWVQQAVDATGASSMGDMGKVMGTVMRAHKGEADGNLVKRLASELLRG